MSQERGGPVLQLFRGGISSVLIKNKPKCTSVLSTPSIHCPNIGVLSKIYSLPQSTIHDRHHHQAPVLDPAQGNQPPQPIWHIPPSPSRSRSPLSVLAHAQRWLCLPTTSPVLTSLPPLGHPVALPPFQHVLHPHPLPSGGVRVAHSDDNMPILSVRSHPTFSKGGMLFGLVPMSHCTYHVDNTYPCHGLSDSMARLGCCCPRSPQDVEAARQGRGVRSGRAEWAACSSSWHGRGSVRCDVYVVTTRERVRPWCLLFLFAFSQEKVCSVSLN